MKYFDGEILSGFEQDVNATSVAELRLGGDIHKEMETETNIEIKINGKIKQPKFKVGQTVWYSDLDDRGIGIFVNCIVIEKARREIENDELKTFYWGDDGSKYGASWFKEKDLRASFGELEKDFEELNKEAK